MMAKPWLLQPLFFRVLELRGPPLRAARPGGCAWPGSVGGPRRSPITGVKRPRPQEKAENFNWFFFICWNPLCGYELPVRPGAQGPVPFPHRSCPRPAASPPHAGRPVWGEKTFGMKIQIWREFSSQSPAVCQGAPGAQHKDPRAQGWGTAARSLLPALPGLLRGAGGWGAQGHPRTGWGVGGRWARGRCCSPDHRSCPHGRGLWVQGLFCWCCHN